MQQLRDVVHYLRDILQPTAEMRSSVWISYPGDNDQGDLVNSVVIAVSSARGLAPATIPVSKFDSRTLAVQLLQPGSTLGL